MTRVRDLRAALRDLGFPCVVKPSDGTARLSVVHMSHAKQLDGSIAGLEANANYGRGLSRSSDIVVEEFVSGDLISVEACIFGRRVHSLGITNRRLRGFPSFIEMGVCYFVDCPSAAESLI